MRAAILALLLCLLFRIEQVRVEKGLDKNYIDPEIENAALFFEPLRDYLGKQPEYLLPQPESALLSGMVLGIKSSLPSDLQKALRDTSTIHMVVVSGQNLTLLSGFILNLAWLVGRKKAVILSVGTTLFYALLTGLGVPVIRASIMVIMSSLAQLTGREGEGFRVLLITALLMLIYNPSWILSVSFQLSFLATVGVIASTNIEKYLYFVPKVIKSDLSVTIAAQLLTLPVIASNFHQISLTGIIANSLLLWTVPPIMISGMAAILISFIQPWLGELAAIFPGVLLTYYLYIVDFFSQFGSIYIGRLNLGFWVGYYLLLLGSYFMLSSRYGQKVVGGTVKTGDKKLGISKP